MRASRAGTKAWLLGSALLFSCPMLAANAHADQRGHGPSSLKPTASFRTHKLAWAVPRGTHLSNAMYFGRRGATQSYGVSCVPYARQVSGIEVVGNAWQWWNNA